MKYASHSKAESNRIIIKHSPDRSIWMAFLYITYMEVLYVAETCNVRQMLRLETSKV